MSDLEDPVEWRKTKVQSLVNECIQPLRYNVTVEDILNINDNNYFSCLCDILDKTMRMNGIRKDDLLEVLRNICSEEKEVAISLDRVRRKRLYVVLSVYACFLDEKTTHMKRLLTTDADQSWLLKRLPLILYDIHRLCSEAAFALNPEP